MFSSSNTRIFIHSIFFGTEATPFHCFYTMYTTAFSGFLISSFISLYSLNRLFTEINFSCLIYELIKASEIKTLIVCNLVFANNTILSCFSLLLMINVCFIIPAVNAQIFNPAEKLSISAGNQLMKKMQTIKHKKTRICSK